MMNKIYFAGILVFALCGNTFCNPVVDNALCYAVTNSCVAQRRVAISISDWGVPDTLFREPAFSNLVSVLSAQVNNCDISYVGSLTGRVERTVFVAALTECGPTVYKNAVTRWFGGNPVNIPRNSELIYDFINPIATSLEDYFDMHFDEPGASNVLLNAKSLFLATSNTVDAAAIDSVLSGAVRNEMIFLRDNGLLERINDGESR